MKKFSCHITGDELIAACARDALPCDAYKWRNMGGDHISFGFAHGAVFVTALYNTFNGRAFGHYGDARTQDIQFSTDDKLDGTPWFDALLTFLYVE